LDPQINKDAWTVEEERVVADAHRLHGNKWAEIAKLLPGRNPGSVLVMETSCTCSIEMWIDHWKEIIGPFFVNMTTWCLPTVDAHVMYGSVFSRVL
jgi:hypothetical protein